MLISATVWEPMWHSQKWKMPQWHPKPLQDISMTGQISCFGVFFHLRVTARSVKVWDRLGAWPICVNESDEQRRYSGWSPCTMGSWVLTPRASVATTAGRVKQRASVWEQAALAEVRARTDVSLVLFGHWGGCVKRWSSYCNATEIDMNILALWFRDQAQPQICSCIFKVSYTISRQTKWVLSPSQYSCKILFWWVKHCCRLERIYDFIHVIFFYTEGRSWIRSRFHSDRGSEGTEVVSAALVARLTVHCDEELSAARFQLHLEWCLWQVGCNV